MTARCGSWLAGRRIPNAQDQRAVCEKESGHEETDAYAATHRARVWLATHRRWYPVEWSYETGRIVLIINEDHR